MIFSRQQNPTTQMRPVTSLLVLLLSFVTEEKHIRALFFLLLLFLLLFVLFVLFLFFFVCVFCVLVAFFHFLNFFALISFVLNMYPAS